MTFRILVLFLFTLSVLQSCDIESNLIGVWEVKSMKVKGEEVKNCLLSKLIKFDENKESFFPGISVFNYDVEYVIARNSMILKGHKYDELNGSYKLKYQDLMGGEFITLENENVFIKAMKTDLRNGPIDGKLIFNYDAKNWEKEECKALESRLLNEN